MGNFNVKHSGVVHTAFIPSENRSSSILQYTEKKMAPKKQLKFTKKDIGEGLFKSLSIFDDGEVVGTAEIFLKITPKHEQLSNIIKLLSMFIENPHQIELIDDDKICFHCLIKIYTELTVMVDTELKNHINFDDFIPPKK